MNNEAPFEVDWDYLLACLPELDRSAKECGALTRRRVVDSAETLLRLALVHAYCDHSLRETAAWAEISGVADISDVALLKRFRRCGPWLAHLIVTKLAERSGWKRTSKNGMRIRLVDATRLRSPGPDGSRWRLHLGIDLGTLSTDHVELTTTSVGESLSRFPASPGELIVGDRGYAHRNQLVKVASSGAFFLVRLPWSVLPLANEAGKPFDLFEFLRHIPDAAGGESTVVLTDSQSRSVSCRLVALRKSPVAAETARKKALADSKRKGRKIDPRTLEAAEYVVLITNLDAIRLPCEEALNIYRLRWQIELVFKRFKSLLNLDHVSAREPRMIQTYVLAKILGALLVEDLTERYLSFFPWGYPLPRPASNIDLAAPAPLP
jgi:hypothetical protein